jgi:Flp pilus assembly protein TadG
VYSKIAKSLRALSHREDGVTAMMFALCLFPVVMAVGAAIDIGRATHTKMKLTSAIDTATLGAAKMLKDGRYSDAQIKDAGLAIFKDNMVGSEGFAVWNESEFDLEVDKVNSKITISVPVKVPTTFTRIAGIENIDMPQRSVAVFALRDIEVGLALDVTGSMNNKVAGKRKIDTLKESFASFATLMLPDNPLPGQRVRLGLAPYSAAVNLGSYAKAVSNNRSADGCVTERTGSAAYTDKNLTTGGFFRVRADNWRDTDPTEGNVGNDAYACPPAVLTALTDDRAKLIADVNAYGVNGWTGGHMGAQWAWNVISPEWASVWGSAATPDDYSKIAERKLVKAVILMTDGSFNTAYHNGQTSSQQAINLCTEMKAKGVLVFSIAFDAPPPAQATLRACASPGTEYYANAANQAELDLAFAQFAGKINALRLAQ